MPRSEFQLSLNEVWKFTQAGRRLKFLRLFYMRSSHVWNIYSHSPLAVSLFCALASFSLFASPDARHFLLFYSPNDVDTNFGGAHALRFLCSKFSSKRERERRDFFVSFFAALSRKKMMMMVCARWLHLPRFPACFFIFAEANERDDAKLAAVRILPGVRFEISAQCAVMYHNSRLCYSRIHDESALSILIQILQL